MKYIINRGTVGNSVYYRLYLGEDNLRSCEVILELANSFDGHPSENINKIVFSSIEEVQEFAVKLLNLNSPEDFKNLWVKYDGN